MSPKSSVPKIASNAKVATRKPKSPKRVTRKAFRPASAARSRVNQKLMRAKEQKPTPSQPMNITAKLPASTKSSMKKTNRLSKAK
jgi:hypothetical protein